MPYSNLKRDKDSILEAIMVDPSGCMVAKEKIKIVAPARYEDADLMSVSEDVYTLSIFAFVLEDKYAVNVVPSRIRLHPSEITTVKYNEETYYEFTFEKGSIITDNINLVKDNTIGYYIYNYFIAYGKVPWFMSVMDMLNILSKSKEYTGAVYGAGQVILEMIVSMIIRDDEDINKYWRQTIQSQSDVYNRPASFIPLRNVPLGARNTTAKLMGAYFDEGLNSALLYPSSTTEHVEELLRQ